MLVTLLALIHVANLAPKPEIWYGPVDIKLPIQTSGNPYDPDYLDVRVTFTNGATKETRLAFFDGHDWRCRLLAHKPGAYQANVTVNGIDANHRQGVIAFNVELKEKLKMPFVRNANNRFILSDDKPFWPVGHSLAWNNPGKYKSLAEHFPEMGENGLTWTRIWSTFWDNRNPYWVSSGPKPQAGYFSQDALSKWDDIVHAAEKSGVRFQWTLHHHGQVSTTVNPNWQDHPWNVKNGGFLVRAEDFFTNLEAKRRTKAYLRYVVARYADSPSIMAWELFNEVQFSDEARNNHWNLVGAWHKEMADYLRSIDPYHHLITTSSEIGKPIWEAMDYYQAHGYPPRVPAMVLGDNFPKDKPYFWGEVGGPEDSNAAGSEHLVIRDAIWSGLLAGNAGSAEYWDWDRMAQPKMYAEFKQDIYLIHQSGFLSQANLKPVPFKLLSGSGAQLDFSPGVGWGPSTVSELALPADANPAVLGHLSSFFQGKAHPEMGKPDLKFTFNSEGDGEFRFEVTGVSASGSSFYAELDGVSVCGQTIPAGSKPNQAFEFKFGQGRHTVVIHNTGGDWINISRFLVSEIGPAITGSMIGNDHWALGRLERHSYTPASWSATSLGVKDGNYKLTTCDLDANTSTTKSVKISGGVLKSQQMTGRDEIIVIRKS